MSKLLKVGSGLYVPLSVKLARALGWQPGTPVEVLKSESGKGLAVRRLRA